MRTTIAVFALALATAPLAAQSASLPRAIYTDPPHDARHPARMEVLHVPSGGVQINGVAYLAAGAGVHPTLVLAHGWPGNEKNLDLAQAVRRAGWNAITFNYRGSWGSPGEFHFAQNPEDAEAVLAYIRDPANARTLGIDTTRIVLAGHSMGGWVTVLTASHDHGLKGAILICAADMGREGMQPRANVIAAAQDNAETLNTTVERMADELMANGAKWTFDVAAPGLASTPLLVLTADDGLAPVNDALVKNLRARGNTRISTRHEATDHSWSDRRIALESYVVRWLDGMAAK